MASIKYEIGENSNEKQLDIVIKLLPQDPFGRYFVTINQFDLREIQFYTKVYDFTRHSCVCSYFIIIIMWYSVVDIFGFNELSNCPLEG